MNRLAPFLLSVIAFFASSAIGQEFAFEHPSGSQRQRMLGDFRRLAELTKMLQSAGEQLSAVSQQQGTLRVATQDARRVATQDGSDRVDGSRSRTSGTPVQFGRERLAMMERLAAQDPAIVLRNRLSAEQRRQLRARGIPVEASRRRRAVVNVVAYDGFGEQPTRYAVTEEGSSETSWATEESVAGMACGDTVDLQELVVGHASVVESAEVIAASASPACNPLGQQNVAVILMHRPGSPVPASTPATWQQRLFGVDNLSLSDFYAASSYGQTSVNGAVFGWYAAAENYECGELSKVRQLAFQAAGSDVDFSIYNRIVLIYEASPGENCGAGGYGSIGCQNLMTPEGMKQISVSYLFHRDTGNVTPNSPPMSTTIHELGHNVGLHHARALNFENDTLGPIVSSGTRLEYGDGFSMMGGTGDFSARHKRYLGWLATAGDTADVSSNGIYTLSRMQSFGPQPRALRLQRRPGDSEEWVWLEARMHSEWERPLQAPAFMDVTFGVFLHYEDEADGPSVRYTDRLSTDVPPEDPRFLRPKLKPGEVWRDNHGPLRLEVLSQDETLTQVKVDYIPPCASVSPPDVFVPSDGGSITFSVQSDAGCTWNVLSDSPYVVPVGESSGNGPGVATFQFEAQASANPRTARLTVGHQVFAITQTGTDLGSEVSSVTLLNRDALFGQRAGFQVLLRDGKGVKNLDKVELRFGPSLGNPFCAAVASLPDQAFSLLGADLESAIHTSPFVNATEGASEHCSFTVLGYRGQNYQINEPQMTITFGVTFTPPPVGVDSAAMAVYARVTGLDGTVNEWKRISPFQVGETCVVRTAGARLMLDAAPRIFSYRVTAPPSCLWAADPGSSPLSFDTEWQVGSRMLEIDVPAAQSDALGNGLSAGLPFEVGTQAKRLFRSQTAGAAPAFPGPSSIVNGASFQQPLPTGSWISVFGQNLASQAGGWTLEDFEQGFLPLGLDGVEVLVSGEPVPISFVSAGQVNALLPGMLLPGPIDVQLRSPFGESAVHEVLAAATSPGIFVFHSEGKAFAAGHDADFVAVGPYMELDGSVVQRPAKAGAVISLYGTGFGLTAPLFDEQTLPDRVFPLLEADSAVVTLGGLPCEVSFIGKSANGLYQMNIRVPSLEAGDHELKLQLATEESQPDVWVRVEP